MYRGKCRFGVAVLESDVLTTRSSSSNKMPAAVKAAVVDIVREGQGDAAEDEAKAYVANMERDGRYTEECWS